jgi:mannitol-1-/sugar-/sorbitol-6-phosphatase
MPDYPAPTRVSAVLFDLDGVLVDSTKVVEHTWRRWARDQHVRADDVLAVAHGRPARDVVRMFAPHLDVEEQVRWLAREETRGSAVLAAIPGARECVGIARQGRWAVVTSGGRTLAMARLAVALLPVPEVLVTADDVIKGKPDPEPYAYASRELAVPAAECVVVEDSPAGVLAAKRAGMTVFAVTTTHPAAALQQADLVFATLDGITRRLRSARS